MGGTSRSQRGDDIEFVLIRMFFISVFREKRNGVIGFDRQGHVISLTAFMSDKPFLIG